MFHLGAGLISAHQMPAQLIILLELVRDHRADIHGPQGLLRRALVLIGHGHFDLRRVRIRVPKTHDVEPRVQRGDESHTDDDNPRDRHCDQSQQIATKNPDRTGHAIVFFRYRRACLT